MMEHALIDLIFIIQVDVMNDIIVFIIDYEYVVTIAIAIIIIIYITANLYTNCLSFYYWQYTI